MAISQQKLAARKSVYDYFVKTALEENKKKGQEREQVSLEDLLDGDVSTRLLLIIPESIGDCINSLSILKSLKDSYPNHNIYVSTRPENFGVFHGNPYIYKILPFDEGLESEIGMIGQGPSAKVFDVFIHLTVNCQKFLNYLSNNNIALDLKGENL